MGETSYEIPPGVKPTADRLDSWKEIANYLNRDVTTVQRWEKREGMPVHRHVHAKRGSVYALTGEISAWQQGRRQPENDPAANVESGLPDEAPASSDAATPPRVRLWLTMVALFCVCAAAIGWLVFRPRKLPATATKIRSLAVLPLRNLSRDPAQEYLADGVTEALTGRLSNIHDLRVISHTSVLRFRNPQQSIPEIARILGVDAVVEGSLIRDGDRIRVTAQLIRGATDEHFWSETYDREMRDALSLESDLAQSIAGKVAVTITGEEHQRLIAARPVAPEVYQSYLQGRFVLEAGNRAMLEQSIPLFEKALSKDPTFAPAYLGLAEAYTSLGTVLAGVPPAVTRPKVVNFARQALAIDPSLVEAHVLLANVLQEQWHWQEAETEYRQALALNPNDADAEARFALWLLCQGRNDQAVAGIQRARALDPSEISGGAVSWILFQSHRYEEAIREARSALAVQPNSAGNSSTLGFALVAADQPQEAISVLEHGLSVSPGSPAMTGVLIRAYAHAGRPNDALRLLAELKKRRQSGYVPAGAFVNAYLGLGDKEQAFYWLEQGYQEQSNILQFLKTHPYFDPIRNDPRFADLVHRVGLD